MANVTGNIREVAGGHLVGKTPKIIFTLNGPNAKSGVMMPTEPAAITPASNGDFTAPLESTTDMHDLAWYTVAIQWADAAGNYKKIDFTDWALQVPPGGGSFSDLFGRPPKNALMFYVSLTAPENAPHYAAWLEDDPNDPENPLNTGNLYMRSNVNG